jgi:predicted DNA-binding transcriptional regulator AlpA
MGNTIDLQDTLLNEQDVARITGLSVASVRRWRLLRQGPRYLKIGASVRYTRKDITAWLGLAANGWRRHDPRVALEWPSPFRRPR